ncbi:MAG: HD domain-containing protein [Desulfovibrionaceae bacterium]|nr:HD domain-containing protein [Desulfovibrionaceae bacterium]
MTVVESLKELRRQARRMASLQTIPAFYLDCAVELKFSWDMFFDHPLILRLQEDCLPFLYDDFGHGVEHSKKVAQEACAIVLVECTALSPDDCRHIGLLAQFAGLLHDTCRLEPHHAEKGAEVSRMVLKDYPISDHDRDLVAQAIEVHEAFRPGQELPEDPKARLLAGALYDADKFRWGPDNFVTTLWEICDYAEWSLKEIADRFPEGLARVEAVGGTFRTRTGRKYGPQMIEQGLALGRELQQRLKDLSGTGRRLSGREVRE